MRGSLIVISAPDPSLFSGGALVGGKESNQLHADAIKNFAMLAVGCCGVFDSMHKDITKYVFLVIYIICSGKGGATKSNEFSEKFQTAFDSPRLHFRKIMLQFFYDRYGCIYARRYDDQIVKGFRSAFFKVYLVLLFSIQLLKKKYPEP